MCEELGWESLTGRRRYRRLLQFYKIVNDLAPSYLKDIIPPLRRSLYGHPRHVFHEIRCHSFTFMHSFLSDSIKYWNNIGSEFMLLSPISKFNEALLSVICPAEKSVFGIHNPSGIKNTVSNAIGSQPIEKSHKKSQLIHPPICASATLRLKIPNIYFVDALFSLFQGFF